MPAFCIARPSSVKQQRPRRPTLLPVPLLSHSKPACPWTDPDPSSYFSRHGAHTPYSSVGLYAVCFNAVCFNVLRLTGFKVSPKEIRSMQTENALWEVLSPTGCRWPTSLRG